MSGVDAAGEVFDVVLIFAGVVAAAAEAEVVGGAVFHVVLHAAFAFEMGAVAEVVVIGLAGTFFAAEDAGHVAVAHVVDGGGAVAATHPRDLAGGGGEDEVHGIGIAQAQRAAVFGEVAVPHDFGDVGEIPADEIDRVTQAAEEPFEAAGPGPPFFEEPAVVGVVVGFDRIDVAMLAGIVVGTLADHRFKKAGALADEDAAAGFFRGIKQGAGLLEIVDERLGADGVFAGLEALEDVRGVQRIGRVDADGIDRRIGEHLFEFGRIPRQTKLGHALLAERFVEVADLGQFPILAVERGRDDASPFA